MKFTKMQGAGNDFVVIDSERNRDWSKLAIQVCDRHFGIGADGLLIVLPSKRADFKMRIFNADGSESSVCGNGLRCLVKHFIDKNGVDGNQTEVAVETIAGIRKATIDLGSDKNNKILVNMGKPFVGLKNIPVKPVEQPGDILDITSVMNQIIDVHGKKMLLSIVSIGNPHAVCFYDGPLSDYPLKEIGPKVEQHRLFPDETNFEIVKVIDSKHVEARVWERGVGETLACGSGACAITAAGSLLGKLDKQVNVKLPGGILHVKWDIDGDIFLSGPAEKIFTGEC